MDGRGQGTKVTSESSGGGECAMWVSRERTFWVEETARAEGPVCLVCLRTNQEVNVVAAGSEGELSGR